MTSNNQNEPETPFLHTLDPGRRVALEIRYLFARAFKDCSVPSMTPQAYFIITEEIAAPILKCAQRAVAFDNPNADSLISELLGIAETIDLSGATISRPLIQRNIDEFKTSLARIGSAQNGIIPQGIARQFTNLDEFTYQSFGKYCTAEIVRPVSHMEIGYIASNKTDGILQLSALLANFRVKDKGRPISIVKISVRDNSFDWQTICQIPYALIHEIVCHGYQGVLHPFNAGRIVVDSFCSWTEGWMDLVALTLLHEWLDAQPPTTFEAKNKRKIKESAGLMSAYRVGQPKEMTPLQLSNRRAAQDAFDYFISEMNEAVENGFGAFSASYYVLSFSLTFNSAQIEQGRRESITEKLFTAFVVTEGSDRDHLIAILMRYTQDTDLIALETELTRLS